MAQTIKIEIPVEVIDKTDALSGIKSKLLGLEDTSKTVRKSLSNMGGSGIAKAWSATTGAVNKLMSPLTSVTRMLSSPVVGFAGLAGASLGMTDAINTYSDFGATMSRVEALANANESQMVRLTQTAKDMGASTKFSATESAEAFTYMAQAGWGVNDMIDGIGGVMSLAAADGLDLASTTSIVSNALTAFGLSAKDTAQFADVLAVASSASNTDVYNLGESLKYAAPVMGALGYNIQDTALALGLMSNNAITGSMAGTALRTSLTNMAKPTDQMAAAMTKYGISLTDSEGNMKSLRGVMENLRGSLGGLSESEQTAAAAAIFGKEAMAGMLAIINASDEDWNNLAQQIDNSAGAADRMAETMQDNLAGALEEMGGAVETAQITFGQRMEPYITSIAGFVTESMPAVEAGIDSIMDFVDAKVDTVGQKIRTLTLSDEWKDADTVGKINLAWDKLIAEPSANWMKETGVHIATGILGGMVSEAAKILPGGEKAGIMSWLSAGTLIKGADKVVSGVKGIVGVLGEISPMAGKFGIAAVAIAAGVTAIAVAVDNYNQKSINKSLEDHFGSIALSAEQVKAVAENILEQDYLVNVNASLGAIQNAEEFRAEAQAALESNDALEFKSRIGITLTADERQEYTDNIKAFIDAKISELESETYSAHIQVQTYLGGTEEGQTLAQNIEKWARADNLELSNLSNDLQTAVEQALTDGIISVDEEQAISALQEKMNNITSRWKQAEAEAAWDWIAQEYGHMTGADLESGAFEDVVKSMQDQRESAGAAIEADAKDFYSKLNAMEAAGRISAEQSASYKDTAGWAITGQQGQELGRSLEFETNTLRDTYGSRLQSNISASQKEAASIIGGEELSSYLKNGNTGYLGNLLNSGSQAWNSGSGTGAFGVVTNADQAALSGLYETMKPDVTAMAGLIDQYRDAGKAIPQALMDSYNEAVQVGAASGDQDAAWASYANQIMESGSDELKSALTDPGNPMYDALRYTLPEGFRDAIDRAAAETTTDPVELEGLSAELNDIETNSGEVVAKAQEEIQSDLAELAAGGSAIEITAEGIQITLGEVLVDSGSAMEQIADALGVTVSELESAGITEAEIETGATITIPPELCQVDAEGLQAAIAEQTSGQADAGTVEVQADTTVTPGNVDASGVYEEVAGETQDTFSEPIAADGSADVSLTQTNNAAAIYSEVGSQVDSTFAAGFSTSASVAVTLNWSLVNPTANISVGGAGSGSASVSASIHAEGGIMSVPHLGLVAEDGPEAIIPLGGKRRNRGLDLWMEAGRMLGVKAYAEGGIVGPKNAGYYTPESPGKTSGKGDSNLPISITLNPSFTINGGEDSNKTMRDIKAHLKELANDLAAEFATRVADVYANAPI